MQDTADAKIICYLPLFITSPAQRNVGRQRNVWRRSVCDCCRRNRLQCRRFSLVTNIVAITLVCTGYESSRKFLEAQAISSSLDGWTVACRPAWWGGWSSALITLSSAVLSLTTPTRSPSPRAVFIYRNEPCAGVAAACCIRQWTSVSVGIEQVRVIQIN